MASLVDKLLVIPAIPLMIGKTLTDAVSGLIFGIHGSPSYGDHVFHSFGRAALTSLKPEQIQWLFPTFVDSYKADCKKKNISPDVVKIPTASGDVDAFWIGKKSTAKYFMVYHHGGGWAMPGSSIHLAMLDKFIRWSNHKLAILCIAYTLSPTAPYPLALSQSVEALRYTLDQPGCTPSNTLLGGDSAGGNLVIGVLSHILHPHPYNQIMKPLKLSEPLFGAVVLDPWVTSNMTRYPSFAKYAQRDSFPTPVVTSWAENYKGRGKNVSDDEYIWPAMAPASWWKSSPCKNMLLTVGEHEVLFDGISDFAKKYAEGAGKEKVTFVVGDQETHIQPLMSPMSDEQMAKVNGTKQEKMMKEWIQQKLV